MAAGWSISKLSTSGWLPASRHGEPTGPREARPDDRLREAIQIVFAEAVWIASAYAQERFGGLLPGEARVSRA